MNLPPLPPHELLLTPSSSGLTKDGPLSWRNPPPLGQVVTGRDLNLGPMSQSAPSALREKLQAQVWALTTACPVQQDNPVGCPLHDIRLRSVTARIEWFKSMSTTELQTLMTRHLACLCTREFLQCFD